MEAKVRDDTLASIRAAFPKEGLFAEKEWLISPEPFAISAKFAQELEKLGHQLFVFQKACNQLYQLSARGKQPLWITKYLDAYSLPGYMWDEIAGVALIDPSIITGQKQLYMDIDVDHGASYGKTIFWDANTQVPPYIRLANVQFDIDAEKFYRLYIDLMTRAPNTKR